MAQMIAHERFVNIEHALSFFARFGFGFVHGVAFLPEELRCAQKQPRPHFPAHDVAPLVDENRQVAIGLDPLGVTRADDRLGRWPNDQRFGQRTGRFHFSLGIDLQPVMGHDRAFLGEAFDVFRFLREIAQRNKERKIGVPMSGRPKHRVELPLHVFPNAVAPWADHHAAAYIGRLGQLRRANDLLIPLRKILFPGRRDGGFFELLS